MNITELIENYKEIFPKEYNTIEKIEEFIVNNEGHIFDRKNMNGHITASGIVIKNGKLLLIKHPYLHLDLCPGGHVENGEDTVDTAIREVREETGYSTKLKNLHRKTIFPININIHVIPKNIKKGEEEHIHIDFCYLLEVTNHERFDNELHIAWSDINRIENVVIRDIIKKLKEVEFNEFIGK